MVFLTQFNIKMICIVSQEHIPQLKARLLLLIICIIPAIFKQGRCYVFQTHNCFFPLSKYKKIPSIELENKKAPSFAKELFTLRYEIYFLTLEPFICKVPFRITVFGERDGS